ncbi:MAG: hypothetical protein KGZ61_08165 [Sandarakinorhabdus sp.]|nr:hypothetical protein [Sandarakinorhabdus sp.]
MADAVFTPADDNFHTPTPGDHWYTETSWFSFNVPERKMIAWLYAWTRKNIPVTGGGVFLFDDTATTPWDIPYYRMQHAQPVPANADLRHIQFPENYSVEMLEPLMRYRLRYADRDAIRIDAEFRGLFAPHGFTRGEPPFFDSGHLDQMGRVTGELILHKERIALDCHAVRDRSWGTRMDHKGSRIGYPYACAADIGFCLFTVPHRNHSGHAEPVNHGFLWLDGSKTALAPGGVRHVERDPVENWITRMEIDAMDVEGRPLRAVGESESRFFLPSPRGVTINSAIRWTVNGRPAYGEDQDVWRLDQWRDARRQRAANPAARELHPGSD